MSQILIIGANGSMGRRYQAILRYFKKPFVCVDADSTLERITKLAALCEGIIIATPTDTHFNYLVNLQSLDKNILCEKPLTKNRDELEYIKSGLSGTKLKMVMQYKTLDTGLEGPSSYNYYNTGKDGLYWDCIQIIGLARGDVKIKGDSPTWQCTLNGQELNLSQMDLAYVEMLKDWFANPKDDMSRLFDMHQKVREMDKNGSH